MERYEQVEIEIIEIEKRDVIATSSGADKYAPYEAEKDYPF